MMRFCAVSSRSDRQWADANLVVLNVPLRWTRMTSSHSCSVMLKTIRSRRMPATLTSTSSRPNSSIAVRIRFSAAAWSEMSAPLMTALPPASLIAATVSLGGPLSAPDPSTWAPRSLTTTDAPSLASSLATDWPIPRPAPATMPTRPSSRPMTVTRSFPGRSAGNYWNHLLELASRRRLPVSRAAIPADPARLLESRSGTGRGGRHSQEADSVAATSPRSGGRSAAGSWQWARTAETPRSLLDAAREVFTDQGFSEASIADVVERAGSSVGSLYHHFGGKSELFIALWQEDTQAQEGTASAAGARARQDGVTEPFDLFVAGTRGYLEGAWTRRDLSLLFNAGDGPPGFELMRRRRGREWIGQNDTLLKLSDTSLNRLYVTVLTSLAGEGAREVAASKTRAQANKVMDAVLEYTRRLMTGGPWQPPAKDAQPGKTAKAAAKRSGNGRTPARRTTSPEPANR